MSTTPCIKVCVMEPTLGLCIGCGRTLDEIAQWGRMWDAERLSIMAKLPERMKNLSTRKSGRVLPSERRRPREN